jgi:hypothetical protein
MLFWASKTALSEKSSFLCKMEKNHSIYAREGAFLCQNQGKELVISAV